MRRCLFISSSPRCLAPLPAFLGFLVALLRGCVMLLESFPVFPRPIPFTGSRPATPCCAFGVYSPLPPRPLSCWAVGSPPGTYPALAAVALRFPIPPAAHCRVSPFPLPVLLGLLCPVGPALPLPSPLPFLMLLSLCLTSLQPRVGFRCGFSACFTGDCPRRLAREFASGIVPLAPPSFLGGSLGALLTLARPSRCLLTGRSALRAPTRAFPLFCSASVGLFCLVPSICAAPASSAFSGVQVLHLCLPCDLVLGFLCSLPLSLRGFWPLAFCIFPTFALDCGSSRFLICAPVAWLFGLMMSPGSARFHGWAVVSCGLDSGPVCCRLSGSWWALLAAPVRSRPLSCSGSGGAHSSNAPFSPRHPAGPRLRRGHAFWLPSQLFLAIFRCGLTG